MWMFARKGAGPLDTEPLAIDGNILAWQDRVEIDTKVRHMS